MFRRSTASHLGHTHLAHFASVPRVSRSTRVSGALALPDGEAPRAGWLAQGALILLLAALILAAATYDRQSWPAVIGDEATYLMAAESLAWDLDLRYTSQDYERFVAHWDRVPEGLILQSGDSGRNITFGKPFFYPLFAAPFVRLAPTRGIFVANAVLLMLAGLVAARALRGQQGWTAPLTVAVSIFASVMFAYVFWAHADLFLASLTAIGLGLVSLGRASDSGGSSARWAVIGALMAVVIFSRPFYLPLLLGPLLALPRGRRLRSAVALLLGAVITAGCATFVHRVTAGAWTSYGAERHGFYTATGFPGIDLPVEQWETRVADLGNAAWSEASLVGSLPPLDAGLWTWNTLYLLVGRNIGLLPYFLPIVFGLFRRSRAAWQWALLIGVTMSLAAFLLYRPFNLYGGGGAIANRYFLPLYPAFWFMTTLRAGWLRLVLVTALAAPFLWPLWAGPRQYPVREDHTYRYVSSSAQHLLPYETTQSHLKPSGRSDVVHGTLWIKFLTPSMRGNRAGDALLLDRGREGEMLIGSSRELTALDLRLRDGPDEPITVLRGGEVTGDRPLPSGRLIRVERLRERGRHPMWWTWDSVILYSLKIRSDSSEPGRLTLTLSPITESDRPGEDRDE